MNRRCVNQVFLTGHVVLVVDAMTDRNLDAHRQSIEKVFPRLGETCTTADVLNLLGQAPPR